MDSRQGKREEENVGRTKERGTGKDNSRGRGGHKGNRRRIEGTRRVD